MKRCFEFEDDDISWLLATMHKARRQIMANASAYSLELGQTVERIARELEAGGVATATSDPEAEVAVATTKSAPVKKQRKPRQPRDIIPRQHQCTEHPHYGAVRAPRTDCQGCWNFFQHLNPTRYTLARRKFELNQRKKAKAAG